MASLIPGFEYDVFISCRQKDNQPTQSYGWQSKDGRQVVPAFGATQFREAGWLMSLLKW